MRVTMLMLFCVLLVASGQEGGARALGSLLEPKDGAPVPAAKAIEEAEKLVQEVFKADFDKARTASQRIALSKQLLEKAAETSGDSAGCFVLLRHSASLAAA